MSCFLKLVKNLIKTGQLICFGILLYTSLSQKDLKNLQNWIKNSYLFIFSTIIFFTICFKSLYKTFPFLENSLKLNFTIFLMAGFSFGDSVFEIKNLISLILIFSAIFFFVFFYLFEKKNLIEEKIVDEEKERKKEYIEIKIDIDKVKHIEKFGANKNDKDNSMFK